MSENGNKQAFIFYLVPEMGHEDRKADHDGGPGRTKGPAWWGPGGFIQVLVPGGDHAFSGK